MRIYITPNRYEIKYLFILYKNINQQCLKYYFKERAAGVWVMVECRGS